MGRLQRTTKTLTIEGMLREGQPATSIARAMGISKQRVNQIKQRMLAEERSGGARDEQTGQNSQDRHHERETNEKRRRTKSGTREMDQTKTACATTSIDTSAPEVTCRTDLPG